MPCRTCVGRSIGVNSLCDAANIRTTSQPPTNLCRGIATLCIPLLYYRPDPVSLGPIQVSKVKYTDIAVRSLTCLAATGTHMLYRITECYLPPDRGDIPAFTPAEAGTRLSDPGGIQGWVTWLACYIPRWYTRPKTVTHLSTKRARRGLTSFMRRTPLTTTPRIQPLMSSRVCSVRVK